MPEFESDDEMPFRSLTVHFLDQEAVDDFCEKIEQTITDKTKYIYHPKQQKDDLKAFGYVETADDEF